MVHLDLASFQFSFAFRFYYEVGEKYIISYKTNFWMYLLNEKSQRHGSYISRGWKDFLCVYVCVCVCAYVCACVCVCVFAL